MNNYICINSQKIGLTEEQVEKIVAAYNMSNVKLSDIPEGDTCKIGENEFVVLEHKESTTVVVLKNLLPEVAFGGDSNRYDGSNVDRFCCEFAEDLFAAVGSDNVIPHTVDLTSNDGLKDYGQIERAVSLLTADLYRRYVQVLDKEKVDGWWWLATPWSTPSHESDRCALCVSPSGRIDFDNCDYVDCDVRPFCILKSNIFVSR